ncbi:MAG TPA: hypothetical protein VFQ79_23485 [Bryobacteraceae bacterium]|nr:hypothetical protein [Bryobacteraceae bacterium]
MSEKRNSNPAPRLTLPSAAVKRLAEAGIHCRPEIGLEYQRAASRYVLRGRESGGATSELGRYVSFSADDGQRLPWLIRPDSLARNGDHAIVVAPLLVSIEMFRFEHTYALLILRHTILETEKGKRPAVSSQVVFRGWQGQLPLDLAGKDKSQAGKIAPEFFDRSGEPKEPPPVYVEAVQAVTKAVNCINCSHPHFLVAKPSSLSSSSWTAAPSSAPVLDRREDPAAMRDGFPEIGRNAAIFAAAVEAAEESAEPAATAVA